MDSTDAQDLAFASVLGWARRIRLLSEASAASLREQRGCEVDREDMLLLLGMLEGYADDLLDDLQPLKPEGFDGFVL